MIVCITKNVHYTQLIDSSQMLLFFFLEIQSDRHTLLQSSYVFRVLALTTG